METATKRQKLLHDAQTLRSLIEAERESSDEEDIDTLLLIVLDLYIRDLEYQLGIIAEYADKAQRLIFLGTIIKLCNIISEALLAEAETQGISDEDLPPAAAGLLRLLVVIVQSIGDSLYIENLEAIEAEAG